jgi:hypothetical protein
MYHFGVSGLTVWVTHILLGLLLSYIGYSGVGNGKISKNMSLILLVTGVLAASYHAHILYIQRKNLKN